MAGDPGRRCDRRPSGAERRTPATVRDAQLYARAMGDEVVRGTVRFFRADKGWGGIESADTPGDVWVHHSVIEMPGFRTLSEGQQVEFRYESGRQDSWNYRATWVEPLEAESDPG